MKSYEDGYSPVSCIPDAETRPGLGARQDVISEPHPVLHKFERTNLESRRGRNEILLRRGGRGVKGIA